MKYFQSQKTGTESRPARVNQWESWYEIHKLVQFRDKIDFVTPFLAEFHQITNIIKEQTSYHHLDGHDSRQSGQDGSPCGPVLWMHTYKCCDLFILIYVMKKAIQQKHVSCIVPLLNVA